MPTEDRQTLLTTCDITAMMRAEMTQFTKFMNTEFTTKMQDMREDMVGSMTTISMKILDVVKFTHEKPKTETVVSSPPKVVKALVKKKSPATRHGKRSSSEESSADDEVIIPTQKVPKPCRNGSINEPMTSHHKTIPLEPSTSSPPKDPPSKASPARSKVSVLA